MNDADAFVVGWLLTMGAIAIIHYRDWLPLLLARFKRGKSWIN